MRSWRKGWGNLQDVFINDDRAPPTGKGGAKNNSGVEGDGGVGVGQGN
jgi:hypothetical protein